MTNLFNFHQKKFSYLLLSLQLICMPFAIAGDFTNGGFETGTTSGWSIYGGTWTDYTASPAPLDPSSNAWTLNSSNAAVTIMSSSNTDKYITSYNTITGSSISNILAGSKSLRINDNNNNQSVSVIKQSVTGYTSSTLYVGWLAVLQGSHGPTDSDHFVIKVHDDTTNTTVATISYSSATTATYFTNVGSNKSPVYVSGWQAQAIDVTAGNNYTLSILAADCPYGGHWGYVYLDSIGANAPPTGANLTSGNPLAAAPLVNTSNHDIVGVNELAATLIGNPAILNPRFDGGILVMDGTPLGNYNFTITTNGGAIDASGLSSIFSTIIANDPTVIGGVTPGGLLIVNSASSGLITFTAANTYTGSTTIDPGATLALSGGGSIAYSSGVYVDGTFDISQINTSSTSINALGDGTYATGTGLVNLGGKTLVIGSMGGSGNYSGVITNGGLGGGTGGSITITGSGYIQTLSGINTYTGSTTIDPGATLIMGGAGQLGAGTYAGAIINNGLFIYSSTANQTLNGIISGSGALTKEQNSTLTLNGANTYTGSTTISAGTLIIGGAASNSTASTAGSTSISSGATLAGYGTVGSNGTTLTNSGTVSPGNNSIGTLSVGGSYVQNSGGNLAISIAPHSNDLLAVTGTANLSGALTVNGVAGSYSPTRYTLLTSSGRSGSFNTFNYTNPYTTLGYFLTYDNNNVYLTLGPDYINTTNVLKQNLEEMRSIFAAEGMQLLSGLNYDCSIFGANNVCLSLGGRVSYVYNKLDGFNNNSSSPMTTSALLIGAYRAKPYLRLGAWVDQDLHVQNSNFKLSNSNPMFGIFGVYYPTGDHTEWQLKLAASYVNKNIDITRNQLTNTEAGSGKTSFSAWATQLELAYGFSNLISNSLVSPFIGLRNFNGRTDAYTETSSPNVQSPISYSAYSQWSNMAYGGLKLDGNLQSDLRYNLSLGIETNLKQNDPTYSGTSNIYGLNSFNLTGSTNARSSRLFGGLGLTYMIEKNQSLYLGGYYRQDQFKGIGTASGMLIYTIGL